MSKLAASGILLVIAQVCYADLSGSQKELSDVQTNIKSVQQNISEIQTQKEAINTQLADIEKRYGEIAASLRQLEVKIRQKNQRMDSIKQEKQMRFDELTVQNKELAGQVRAAYAMGKKERLKLLLNQQDSAKSSRMMAYYRYLGSTRLAKVSDIQKSLAQLDNLDSKALEEKTLLEQDLQQKKIEQTALSTVKEQRAQLLLQLNSDFSSNEQQLVLLKEGENKLKELIDSWQSEGVTRSESEQEISGNDHNETPESTYPETNAAFSNLKGKLPWPVKGQKMEKLGSSDEGAIANGVLINAKEGTEIRAVTAGKVAFSEWLNGYGLLIILDHGDNYMTLYAFNQSLYKQAGDSVAAGEVIASVGQSGGRSHPGLYFAIRKKGQPIDPVEWCKKSL